MSGRWSTSDVDSPAGQPGSSGQLCGPSNVPLARAEVDQPPDPPRKTFRMSAGRERVAPEGMNESSDHEHDRHAAPATSSRQREGQTRMLPERGPGNIRVC